MQQQIDHTCAKLDQDQRDERARPSLDSFIGTPSARQRRG
jgi:hypothetical protein